MTHQEQTKFTVRLSSNAVPSYTVIGKIHDHTGAPRGLFTPDEFDAAQRDPKAACMLHRDRFARTYQIQAVFYEMALRLIAELEAEEGGWAEFDHHQAQSLRQPLAVA